MRIPSGDLAPARKRRRNPYRKRRSPWPFLLALLLVAGAAGGAWALRTDDRQAADVVQAARCPSPTAPAAASRAPLPKPGQVRLRLLNGTPRQGLAATVGQQLRQRGFVVTSTGNAPRALPGASKVYFGPGAQEAATLVAAHVIGAETALVRTAPRGAVDVVLGTAFQRVRTPAELAVFLKRPGPRQPAVPAPSPCR